MSPDYTLRELMVIEGARSLSDGQVVFVGTGLPVLASMLAQRTHAPNLVLIIETGPFAPAVLPGAMAVSDPRIWHGAHRLGSLLEVLGGVLQRGLCDVGFLGGAQIDRYGNLNSTCIGDPAAPKVRLVGSGGASDIASNARKVYVITRHERRRFVERCDYITSPGFLSGGEERAAQQLPGSGPELIITDLGVMGFQAESKEMTVLKLHPGVPLEQIQSNTGFPLRVSDHLDMTEPPERDELVLLRSLDVDGTYLA